MRVDAESRLASFVYMQLRGDVNHDSETNIADVNAVINNILQGPTDSNCDVNHDGEVNIADVRAIINWILKGG